MRYFNKFLCKVICLMILITVLTSIGIPLDHEKGMSNSFASNKKDENTEYIVKKGDTLNSIADEFSIDLYILIKDNNITNKNKIYPGQKLIISKNNDLDKDEQVTPNSSNKFDEDNSHSGDEVFSNRISLNVQDADIRDIISIIASHINKNAILLEEPIRTSFKIENVSPYKALGLLLQSLGMDYIEDNNLIIVGQPEKLQMGFFNQMLLTRFNLKYISSETLQPLIQQLGIPAESITIDENPKTIWIQGTPSSLSKIREVILVLDKRENGAGSSQLVCVNLNNLTTEQLAPIMRELNMPVQVITIPDILSTLWIKGSDGDIKDAKAIIASLDIIKPSSQQDTLFLFKLNNISAIDASQRLAMFAYEGVQTIEFYYPEFGQDLLVLCPLKMKTKVTTALEGLDFRGLGDTPDKIMLPIDSATGPHSYDVLESRRSLLIKLIDDLEDSRDIIDVSNVLWTESGDEYRVLLVKAIPDIIHKANEMIKLIDSPK